MSDSEKRFSAPRVPTPASGIDTAPGRRALISAMADAFEGNKTVYIRFHGVEHIPLQKLRSFRTDGTIMQPIVLYLEEAGHPIPHSVGAVMDTLDWTKDNIHTMACGCHHKSAKTPAQLVPHLRKLAQPPLTERVGDWFATKFANFVYRAFGFDAGKT